MQYKLIKLPEEYIIVSAKCEEGISPKVEYYDKLVDKNNICKVTEAFTDKVKYLYITGIKEDFRLVYEIIASTFIPELPTIDFNNLEEEFGIVDAEKLANLLTDNEGYSKDEGGEFKNGIEIGFNKCLELNKDKLYTEEDLKAAFSFYAFASSSQQPYNEDELVDTFNEFTQSLQPKTEWDIKIELSIYKPKIVDNKIKIIKIT